MSVLFHYICNVYMLPPERVTPFNIGSNVNIESHIQLIRTRKMDCKISLRSINLSIYV